MSIVPLYPTTTTPVWRWGVVSLLVVGRWGGVGGWWGGVCSGFVIQIVIVVGAVCPVVTRIVVVVVVVVVRVPLWRECCQ